MLYFILAELIKFNMDENVDPCDDFYEFACGGFVKKTAITNDETNMNSFNILNKKIEKQLHKILAKDIQPNDLRAFKLAKTLYKSCMNESMFSTLPYLFYKNEFTFEGFTLITSFLGYLKEQNLKPVFSAIEQLGGWPVLLPNWNETAFDWKKEVYLKNELGYGTSNFIGFDIDINQKNSSQRIIKVRFQQHFIHFKLFNFM